MKWLQRLFTAVLPATWAERMQAESQLWRIRCRSCGASQSLWDAGGIRWNASSRRKFTLVNCSRCGGVRTAVVERTPEGPESGRTSSHHPQS